MTTDSSSTKMNCEFCEDAILIWDVVHSPLPAKPSDDVDWVAFVPKHWSGHLTYVVTLLQKKGCSQVHKRRTEGGWILTGCHS